MIADEVKLLRKIQHLVLIRDEAMKVGSADNVEALTEDMRKLVDGLEPSTRALYTRLFGKSHLFLSPISKGNCSACGLRLPASVLQHVIGCDRMTVCDSCGRILYLPEVKATGIRMSEPDPRLLLSRFSTAKLMVPALKATSPDEAIAEMGALLAKEKVVSDADAVVAAALEREKILTTAVGHGLAFPHMRGVEEGVLTFAAGVSPNGIDWNGELVHLAFFTVMPVVASPFYLRLLSALASSFADDEKLPFVLAAPDAKSLWKELNKVTRVAVKNM